MDKALIGNFRRELGGGCYNCWTHCCYHSASAVVQMLAGTEGHILWDKSDRSYSDIKSDSIIDWYGVWGWVHKWRWQCTDAFV